MKRIKCFMAWILIFMMVFMVFPLQQVTCAATSHTSAEAGQWARDKIGGDAIDWDGDYGVQCVDFILWYTKEFWGVDYAPQGDASAYSWNSMPSGWTRIKNSSGFVAMPGDIAVWTYCDGTNYGHIGVVTSADSIGMTIAEQWSSTGVAAAQSGKVQSRYFKYNDEINTFYGVVRPLYSDVPTISIDTTINENSYIFRSDSVYLNASKDDDGGNVNTVTNKIQAQKWDVKKVGNSYQIISQNSLSGRVLNVYTDGTSANGTNVTLWKVTGHPTQLWQFEKKGDGYRIHPSDNLNVSLTVVSGGDVKLANNSDGESQIWHIEIPEPSPTHEPHLTSVVNERNDGTWLFPVDESDYSITDWAGCSNGMNGSSNPCIFDGLNHYDYGDAYHRGQSILGHNGIDIAVSYKNVFASASGTVKAVLTGDNYGRGNYIVIEHTLDSSRSYYSVYQHLNSISKRVGDTVNAGDIIGVSGDSGTPGSLHLHFAILIGAKDYTQDISVMESGGWFLKPGEESYKDLNTKSGNIYGRVLNNPSVQTYSLYPVKITYPGALESHCGSVTYTFDKHKVTLPPASNAEDKDLTTAYGDDVTINAIMTKVGTKFDWYPSNSALGYRIYRSTSMSDDGISITDFPIMGGEYVDVNVEPYTQYYYTIRKVLSETSFDQTTMELTPEVQGSSSEALAIATGEIIEPEADSGPTKHSILMEIDNPIMLIDTETLEIDPGRGTAPMIVNGRTLVPIRAIAEAMGGSVGWDNATRTVTIDCMGRNVEMTLDSKIMTVDGMTQEMDIAAQTINDRTVLPVRFVGEALGCVIEWIGSTRQIIVVFYQ